MSCPVLSLELVDYMAEAIKKIMNGKKNDKKACICRLISVLNSDKCEVYFEYKDKLRNTLFPSCAIITFSDNDPYDFCDKGPYSFEEGFSYGGPFGNRSLALTAKQMMYLYWRAKTLKLNGISLGGSSTTHPNYPYIRQRSISFKNVNSQYFLNRGSFEINKIPEYEKISDVVCLDDLLESREASIFYDYYNFKATSTETILYNSYGCCENFGGMCPCSQEFGGKGYKFSASADFILSRNNIIYHKDKFYPLVYFGIVGEVSPYEVAHLGCEDQVFLKEYHGGSNLKNGGKLTINFPFPPPDDKAVANFTYYQRVGDGIDTFNISVSNNFTIDIDPKTLRSNE